MKILNLLCNDTLVCPFGMTTLSHFKPDSIIGLQVLVTSDLLVRGGRLGTLSLTSIRLVSVRTPFNWVACLFLPTSLKLLS